MRAKQSTAFSDQRQAARTRLFGLGAGLLFWGLVTSLVLWASGSSLAQAQWVTGPVAVPPGPQTSVAEADHQDDTPIVGHVEHFGFYASAMNHWNYTAELAPFTTLTWIHVYVGDNRTAAMQDMVARVREARDHDVQAVLSLEPFLFANAEGTPLPDAVIEETLIDLRARLENEELLDTVLMLYPKDEPFREFRRARDPNVFEEYVTGEVYDDIEADLNRVLAHLEAVFPEKPRGAILSGYELHHRFFSIPTGYDWIGFNCYENLFEACEDRSYIQLYGRLLANMTPEQRLIAVPETWARHASTDRDDWPEVLSRRLLHHWELVQSEPRFIAVIPFLWSFEAPNPTEGIGMDRFPETWDGRTAGGGTAFRETLELLGQAIKTGTPTYPNMAWADTEDHPSRSDAVEQGEITAISAEGLVRVQALDPALPHKNLRVRIILRDSQGRVLARTPLTRTHLSLELPVADTPDDGVLPGTHGLTWQIPTPLLDMQDGQALEVELLTYADGPEPLLAHHTTRTYQPRPVIDWPFRYYGLLIDPDFWNIPYVPIGPVPRP
ncbi:MAG: hypothetical protein AAGH19_09750 [Pseudomonadota bacterium]